MTYLQNGIRVKKLKIVFGVESIMLDNLNATLQEAFAGKIVRKDLTKKIKEGANVPVYVLEYLLGMYCATDDEASIEAGVERVKNILADNFVRPDEAENSNFAEA